ncbi:amidohydrolase family protein [Muricoccus radiodurans]|uniref:amidohydrolase family protein n=1 Tax=Muricoccus radiodurans TaxID=2231721 RepID=UPI003CF60DE2
MSVPKPKLSPAYAPVRPDWLDSRPEPVLEPDLPIIDAHHHLWDREGNRYLLDELLRDTGTGHRVEATVYVQARSMHRECGPAEFQPVGEVEFVNGVAAMTASGIYGDIRACAGIVGYTDLTLGDRVEPALEALVRAAPDRFRGIRTMTAYHPSPEIVSAIVRPPPSLMMEARFRQGVARLEQHGLSLDIWAFHTQLDEVLDLARAFPGITMVLDHCGGPLGIGPYAGRRAEVLAEWTTSIRRIAACPNVVVKLGGLAMHVSGFDFHERPLPPSSEELAEAWRPYVETCIEAFGARRCMFESNFPVDKGMCGYAAAWNAFKRLAASGSAEEKAALFAGTARSVYRLPMEA